MSRRKSLNWFDKLFLWVLALLFVFVAFAVLVIIPIGNKQSEAYHQTMSVLDTMSQVSSQADKAVTYTEDQYSTYRVPTELQAETPEEVRYVIHLVQDEELVGRYSNGMGGFRHVYRFEIVDLSTGEIIAARDFTGGSPPSSTTKSTPQYGSLPSREDSDSWILSVIAH